MSPQPGTPFFGIITIPISLYRSGDGDDGFSAIARSRLEESGKGATYDLPERNLGEPEPPGYDED
jgi:hypothetical protein